LRCWDYPDVPSLCISEDSPPLDFANFINQCASIDYTCPTKGAWSPSSCLLIPTEPTEEAVKELISAELRFLRAQDELQRSQDVLAILKEYARRLRRRNLNPDALEGIENPDAFEGIVNTLQKEEANLQILQAVITTEGGCFLNFDDADDGFAVTSKFVPEVVPSCLEWLQTKENVDKFIEEKQSLLAIQEAIVTLQIMKRRTEEFERLYDHEFEEVNFFFDDIDFALNKQNENLASFKREIVGKRDYCLLVLVDPAGDEDSDCKGDGNRCIEKHPCAPCGDNAVHFFKQALVDIVDEALDYESGEVTFFALCRQDHIEFFIFQGSFGFYNKALTQNFKKKGYSDDGMTFSTSFGPFYTSRYEDGQQIDVTQEFVSYPDLGDGTLAEAQILCAIDTDCAVCEIDPN